MGTRNLTMVIADGKIKVAQYGQWDGYLAGQGMKVLSFLKTADLDVFKQRVSKVKFVSERGIKSMYKKLGITGEYMNMSQAAEFKKLYPSFDRDMAAEVLQSIYDCKTIELEDNTKFAADSLFCEYAYVIDLDKNVLEVYMGFNKEPLTEKDRFYYLQDSNEEYTPIKIIGSFPLNLLPDESIYLGLESVEQED